MSLELPASESHCFFAVSKVLLAVALACSYADLSPAAWAPAARNSALHKMVRPRAAQRVSRMFFIRGLLGGGETAHRPRGRAASSCLQTTQHQGQGLPDKPGSRCRTGTT